MTVPATTPDRSRRNVVVGASVNLDEEAEIVEAFQQASYGNKSKAARVILLSFARNTKVRDIVAAYIRDNLELLAD